MILPPPTSETPATARFHRQAIETIIECVQEGVYCALLGPRLSGKTVFLHYVEGLLERTLGVTCVYLDMRAMRSATLRGFFADLQRFSARHFYQLTNQPVQLPGEDSASSATFRGFLVDSITQMGRDVVLIIEHLEAVPIDLVQALLTSLRAAYMDQQPLKNRLVVIVSGALSLANMTVGESSPFRGIARRVFIGDLTEEASQMLIEEYLTKGNIVSTSQARRRLLQAASGDQFLIRQLSQRCIELVKNSTLDRLGAPAVNRITHRFLNSDVFQYAPLLEAVRLIEDDPDLMRCIVHLLNNETTPKTELPLPLSPDLDPLYLTGVVERVGNDHYRLQNHIYRQFLAQHFTPGRVGHMLAMAGRWDAAIDFLESGVQDGDQISFSDLLPATIHSMYAAEDLSHAAHFLTRGLSAAFGITDIQIWYADKNANLLQMIGRLITEQNGVPPPDAQIAINADCLEARSWRQAVSLRGHEHKGKVWRTLPLAVPGEGPIGVVTIWDDLSHEGFGEARERDLQIVGYLHQSARAFQVVSTRRRELALAGRMQASLLPAGLPQLYGWSLAATWQPARETSGDFYDFINLPGSKLGILVADVVDKGMGAALYMALSRTLIRTFASEYPPQPEEVLRAANSRLISDATADHFVTAFYMVLNPATGQIVYCNAGHHPPYIFDPRKPSEPIMLTRTAMAMGITTNTDWRIENAYLHPGSVLVLYTDGIVDAMNREDELFGAERMLASIEAHADKNAEEIQTALLEAIATHRGAAARFDDISMVIVKRDPLDE
ncbi:SpoIIE family protein phosphatase [Chloroflexota bacterium]